MASLLALLALLSTQPAQRPPEIADTVKIQEWVVPWETSRPRDPYVDRNGIVWFVGQRSDYVASLDPAGGTFRRFDLPAGTGPHNLIVDEDGIVWYAGNRQAYIGRLDPESGEIRKYPMPESAAHDPHTLVFDGQGNIWFTVQGGNYMGKLAKTSGQVDLIASPISGSRPYGIVMDESGRPWVALFGTNKLASIDPATLELKTIDLPREEARPRRLVTTSDGSVWYVDYAGGMLGRYNPEDGSFTEWEMPSGAGSRPYGMAVDGQDRVWFVETGPQPNNFVGFDTGSESFISTTPVPSGGETIRNMFYDEERDAVWFGTDANTIGRAELPSDSDV